jgi:Fur family iron response transcriptional regulator
MAKQTKHTQPDLTALERLRAVGLRPTRQRLALARLLFAQGHRHVSAEDLFKEAMAHRIDVSLATIYNALHDFTAKGLLRALSIDSMGSYFDTNTSEHHHFFFEHSGRLEDIRKDKVRISSVPPAPKGAEISRVDVVIRVKG